MLDDQPVTPRAQREPDGPVLSLDDPRGDSTLPPLLREAPDAVVVLDADGVVVTANAAAARLLGRTPDALPGALLVDLAHPDDADDVHAALSRLVDGGEPIVDHGHRFGTDRPRWIDWSAWRSDGHVVFHGRDAQVRRAAAEAHWRSESRYRFLLDTMQEGVWFLDHDLRTTYASPRLAAMLDRTPDQMFGETLDSFLGDTVAARVRGLHGRGLNRIAHEVTLPGHGVPTRTGMLCACTLDESPGNDGYLVTLLDVTDQRLARTHLDRMNLRLENQVRRRTEALRAAKEDLEVVSLAVSHDVRGSIRAACALMGWATSEHAASLPEEVQRGLTHAEEELRGIDTLVEGLLRLGHVGHRVLEVRPVDVTALATEVVAGLRSRGEADDIMFHVPPMPPCHGDADLLREVLLNLLGNACKYAERRVEMVGTVDAEGRTVEYGVRDDGPGFEESEARHLFDLFRRGRTSDGTPGYGMGLAIVKRIVMRHGGIVRAIAHPGEGGEFRFRLPARAWQERDGVL